MYASLYKFLKVLKRKIEDILCLCNTFTIFNCTQYSNTVLNQNYSQYSNNFCKSLKGIDTGTPIWGPVAEIFFQRCDNLIAKHMIETKNIIFYNK